MLGVHQLRAFLNTIEPTRSHVLNHPPKISGVPKSPTCLQAPLFPATTHLRSQIQLPSVSQQNRENYLSPHDLMFAQSNLCIRPIHRKVATLFEQFFCHRQVTSLLPLGRQISFQETLQSVVLGSLLIAVGYDK